MKTYVRMWYLRFIDVGSIRYRVNGARTHATAQLPFAIDPISNQLTDRSVNFRIKNLQIAFPSGSSFCEFSISDERIYFDAILSLFKKELYLVNFREIHVHKYDEMIILLWIKR